MDTSFTTVASASPQEKVHSPLPRFSWVMVSMAPSEYIDLAPWILLIWLALNMRKPLSPSLSSSPLQMSSFAPDVAWACAIAIRDRAVERFTRPSLTGSCMPSRIPAICSSKKAVVGWP